jgi:CDP-diacylglycerol--glycerol-3-phosphate 3-phosphatidyltransferase
VLDRFKAFWQGKALAPFVNLFIRLGVSPDVVTLVGTLGVSFGALFFFAQGWVWQGVLFITAFVFSDLIAWHHESRLYLALSLVILVMGAVTSYARAKADHLGYDAKVGIAERPDRLVGMLVPAFFADLFDVWVLLYVALWALAVAATVTVAQRIWVVRRQALARAATSA